MEALPNIPYSGTGFTYADIVAKIEDLGILLKYSTLGRLALETSIKASSFDALTVELSAAVAAAAGIAASSVDVAIFRVGEATDSTG